MNKQEHVDSFMKRKTLIPKDTNNCIVCGQHLHNNTESNVHCIHIPRDKYDYSLPTHNCSHIYGTKVRELAKPYIERNDGTFLDDAEFVCIPPKGYCHQCNISVEELLDHLEINGSIDIDKLHEAN